jgi:hypothetical protein
VRSRYCKLVVAAAVFAFVLVAISSVGASAAAAPGESSTIWIVGNDDLLYQKALYSWPGTGSSSDPIIIDGLTINAASMSENNCIIVSGTDLYVVISNCHLSGSGAYFSNAAIYLELADHIQVIGNEFSSIPFASIYIFQCRQPVRRGQLWPLRRGLRWPNAPWKRVH